jgi:hypothetical protein
VNDDVQRDGDSRLEGRELVYVNENLEEVEEREDQSQLGPDDGTARRREDGLFEVRPVGFAMPPSTPGVAPRRAWTRLWLRRRWLAEDACERGVIVAADAWGWSSKGRKARQFQVVKRFRPFESMRAFYVDCLAREVSRNFYELIPPRRPVKLYLDLEWMSQAPEPERLMPALDIISGEISAWWPHLAESWKGGVYVLEGGRLKGGQYKNSFHVI